MNNKLNESVNKPVPFNTGKVKIGEHYVPPQRNMMTENDEFWQNVLTDVYKEQRRSKMRFILYVVALVIICIALGAAQ